MRCKPIFSLLLIVFLVFSSMAYAEESSDGHWLIANLSGEEADYQQVAEIICPEGFTPVEGISANGEGPEPELYFAPEDPESPVRFFYYTTGYGDCRSLAETALESYAYFYDDFIPSEIEETTVGDLACLRFSYTAAYPGEDESVLAYEQSAVCYFPIQENCFAACIVSLSFDSSEAFLDTEALQLLVDQACAALRWNL